MKLYDDTFNYHESVICILFINMYNGEINGMHEINCSLEHRGHIYFVTLISKHILVATLWR